MITPDVKRKISDAVQSILQMVNDGELPAGEINFVLHIDGAEARSWANIPNNSMRDIDIDRSWIKNLTVT